MVFKFFKNLKKYSKGVTLIEIMVVLFLIALFGSMVIVNFPNIERQSALSRSTYKLAQDLRKVQDMGLSGLKTTYNDGTTVRASGYGIYVDLYSAVNNKIPANQQYTIYADSCPPSAPPSAPDHKYNLLGSYDAYCNYDSNADNGGDHIIDTINVDPDNSGVYIQGFKYSIDGNHTSINFSPPNPDINIENLDSHYNAVEIVLGLKSDPGTTRSVTVNKSGLIDVQ